jgi:hypothetical protein
MSHFLALARKKKAIFPLHMIPPRRSEQRFFALSFFLSCFAATLTGRKIRPFIR